MLHNQGADVGKRSFPTQQRRGRRRQVCQAVGDRDLRRLANVVHELIAAASDRPDQIAVGAQCFSQYGNPGLEIVLLDNPTRPHTADQLVLADDRSPGLDERHE